MATTSIGSSGVTFPDSSTQASSSGVAKAWVNFNGVSGSVAIRASYNVSSITRNATGDYNVNFTNAFADNNYSAVTSVARGDGVGVSGGWSQPWAMAAGTYTPFTTTSARFGSTISNGAATDYPLYCIAFFR